MDQSYKWPNYMQMELARGISKFDVSYIVRKRRLGLFGHVARLRSDVPANQILRICTKTRDGDRPSQEWRRASGRPPTTWIHQICRDAGVTATEALQLAEDRPFWRTITTAGGFGWSLRVTTTTNIQGTFSKKIMSSKTRKKINHLSGNYTY